MENQEHDRKAQTSRVRAESGRQFDQKHYATVSITAEYEAWIMGLPVIADPVQDQHADGTFAFMVDFTPVDGTAIM